MTKTNSKKHQNLLNFVTNILIFHMVSIGYWEHEDGYGLDARIAKASKNNRSNVS